jgi:hypothetical protein
MIKQFRHQQKSRTNIKYYRFYYVFEKEKKQRLVVVPAVTRRKAREIFAGIFGKEVKIMEVQG